MLDALLTVSRPELPQGLAARVTIADLELTVRRGARLVAWGSAASGKSMLARTVAAQVRSARAGRKGLRCMVVPSNPYLLFDGVLQTVAGEVRWAAQRAGRLLSDEDVTAHLAAVQLQSQGAQSVWTLSGGEAVRAALALVQATAPDVVILDDVLSSLDAQNLKLAADLLRQQSARGAAILICQTPAPALEVALSDAEAQVRLPHPPRPPPERIGAGVAELLEIGPMEIVPYVQITDLTYGYRRGARFTLAAAEFESGRCYVSTAPNGRGKTTFFRALTGAIPTTGGEIRAGDRSLLGRSARQAVSFLQVQEPQYQFGGKSVAEEITAAVTPRTADARGRAYALAEDLLGDGLLALNPFSLPRPYQRLLVVLLGYLSRRPLLILDEPTIGLDTSLTAMLRDVLQAGAAAGRQVLCATHDISFAGSLGAESLPLGIRQGHTADEGRRTIHL